MRATLTPPRPLTRTPDAESPGPEAPPETRLQAELPVPPHSNPEVRPPRRPAALGALLGSAFRRSSKAVAAALVGATMVPVCGAPLVAHAQTRSDAPVELRLPPPPPSFDLRDLSTTVDGRTVRLFPTHAELIEWGLVGPTSTSDVAATRPPRDPALDRLLVGVGPDVRNRPWTADFDDYFRARAALSEVPTALAGMALRPVAERGYQIVDQIPAPIRRPFDRALGILLENAVSLPANLLTSRIPISTGPLPESASAPVFGHPQIRNACGEVMVATWLKSQGVPVAVGEIDTQLPFVEGTNLLEDAELRQRGFSLISGPGSFDDLRTYVAHGYPVMVSVGWENGGGHYAVVTGYDERTKKLQIAGWEGDGRTVEVSYKKFQAAWERHLNLMTVAHPQRDRRLDALRAAGRVSRTAEVQEGLSLSEIWVTKRLELFVEAAYRYRGTHDDLTVRVNVNTAEREGGAAAMLGGSLRYAHRFGNGTQVELYAEHLSTGIPADQGSLQAILRSSAAYVGVRHGPISGRAGYDRGTYQAALQADLNRRLYDLGAEARVALNPDGSYRVFFGLSGTF